MCVRPLDSSHLGTHVQYPNSTYICMSRGGGTLDIYWWGCAAAHPKRGVLGTGTTKKNGGLRHGYNPKKGGLRHGHEWKKGVLGTGTSRKRGKKDNLSN